MIFLKTGIRNQSVHSNRLCVTRAARKDIYDQHAGLLLASHVTVQCTQTGLIQNNHLGSIKTKVRKAHMLFLSILTRYTKQMNIPCLTLSRYQGV